MMQGSYELAVFDVRVQPLLGRHLTRVRKQCIPRFIGEPRLLPGVSGGDGAGYESPRFVRSRAGLENQVQACTDGNAYQQLERQLGDPPVHDLAQRRLRDAQQLRGCRLAQLLPFEQACNLQSNIAPQRLDGRRVSRGNHSDVTIVISDLLYKRDYPLIYETAAGRRCR